MTFNLQSGISYMPVDGASLMTIQIGAAASFAGTGNMGFYAGASLWWTQVEVDGGGSGSDSDPVLFGGLQGFSGSLGWSLGAHSSGDATSASRRYPMPSLERIRHLGS